MGKFEFTENALFWMQRTFRKPMTLTDLQKAREEISECYRKLLDFILEKLYIPNEYAIMLDTGIKLSNLRRILVKFKKDFSNFHLTDAQIIRAYRSGNLSELTYLKKISAWEKKFNDFSDEEKSVFYSYADLFSEASSEEIAQFFKKNTTWAKDQIQKLPVVILKATKKELE